MAEVSLLARYEAGEYGPVWAELRAAGAAVGHEPLRSAGLAVARATMRRVRANVDLLIPRLTALGYHFTHPLRTSRAEALAVFTPPDSTTHRQLEEVERRVGPLPLALRAWYEVVGAIDLCGRHPAWQETYTDPLVVWPLWGCLLELDAWQAEREELGAEAVGSFWWEFAPDIYHKANVSGGAPYAVALPDSTADPPVAEEWHETTFVEYLRVALRWGGFPGFERSQRRPAAALRDLTEGLLPF